MADRGSIGHSTAVARADIPRDSLRRGSLSITGTGRNDEVAGRTTLWLFGSLGMHPLMAVESSAAGGAFAFRNLAAGRYFVVVHGQQNFLPGIYAVDVS